MSVNLIPGCVRFADYDIDERSAGRMKEMERNLIDNILECELKLGQADTQVTFYYPQASLTELLGCSRKELASAMTEFQKQEAGRLGKIEMEELENEKGRYAVTIPKEGICWVHENYQPSEFMKAFILEIKKPGNTLAGIVELFNSFSPEVEIKHMDDKQWAVSFKDNSIDPYVYYMEQNEFGLEYHRFTRTAYENLMLEEK